MQLTSRGKRGAILLLALFFMFLLFFMAVAFFKLLPVELHSAARSSRDMKAHYVADGGVKNANAWLTQQLGGITQADLDTIYNSVYDTGTPRPVDGNWGYTSRIDVNSTGNGLFDITSISFYRGDPVREVRATIQQDTFAKYAMWIDRWPSGSGNPLNDLIFTLGDGAVQGPFHTNDFFNLKAPDANYWTSPGTPWVNGSRARMTYASDMPDSQNTLGPGIGDGNRYYGGNYMGSDPGMVPFDSVTGAPDAGAYARMIEGGREKVNKVARINLPDDVTDLRAKAWANDLDTTGLTSAALGISVNTDAGPNAIGGTVKGGIYIDGTANKVHLEIDQGNQKIVARGREDYWRAWVPNIVMEDDWDCVPNGTFSHPEIFNYVPCPKWGIVDWILPNGTNGLTSPEPVYGWIPDGDTCPESFVPPQYGNVENCTNTLICSACIPVDHGHWEEVSEGAPGAQHRTRTSAHDQIVVEVSESSGYTIPDGEWVDGAATASTTTVPENSTIFKNYNEVDSRWEWVTMNGTTNGVVFVDGHIYDLQGTNKGARYVDDQGVDDYHGRVIAVDIKRGYDVYVKQDLLQYYDGSDVDKQDLVHANALKRGEVSPTNQHILGVIGEDIWIDTPNRPGTHFSPSGLSGDGDLALYGIFMAGRTELDGSGNPRLDGNGRPRVVGGFGVVNDDMGNGDGLGLLRLFGGIIQANGRKTYKTYGGGAPQGYGLELNYDRTAAYELENFPTTNVYSVVRYTERYIGN